MRVQQITLQWLIDDEWHAVHKIIHSQGYLPILSSFGQADYSIPLTLYDRMLADTIGLSELRMRFPMLLSGIAFVGLAMLWARTRISTLVAASFGFLLAVSPLLVNYSRNARPYMITLLLAGIAIWALANWARNGHWKHAAIYSACTWLASYLHLLMAPFLLLPLAWVLYLSQTRRMDYHVSPARDIWLGAMVTGAVGAVTLPPLLNDLAAMTGKTGVNLPRLDTFAGVWYIWLGTDTLAVVLLGGLLAAIGWQQIRSKLGLELQLWLAGLTGILVAIYVMQPAWVHNPLTFGRYMLPALPLWLLLIAAGIQSLVSRFADFRSAIMATGCCALFMVGTPHADLFQYPNNFTLHSYYQFDYRQDHSPVREKFSRFTAPSPFWSRFQDAAPGRYTIAVMGQPSFESYFNLQPLYQPHHRQLMINLQTSGACSPDLPGEAFPAQGIHLRNAASLASIDNIQAKQVDWIVVDRRLETRMRKAKGRTQATEYLDRCTEHLQRMFGPPAYADETLLAFHTGSGQAPSLPDATGHPSIPQTIGPSPVGAATHDQ